jgi:ATP-dependent Clp protease ATP-binding subunit ClpA
LGVTPELIKQQVESEIERQPKVYGSSEPVASNRLQNVMHSAKREAVQLKDEFISTEHLLLVIKAR